MRGQRVYMLILRFLQQIQSWFIVQVWWRIKNWFVACVLIYAGGKYQGRGWASSEARSTLFLLKQLNLLFLHNWMDVTTLYCTARYKVEYVC